MATGVGREEQVVHRVVAQPSDQRVAVHGALQGEQAADAVKGEAEARAGSPV